MWRSDKMIQSAIDGLAAKGIWVCRTDMPGLFCLRYGPEITVGQLMDLCRQNGVIRSGLGRQRTLDGSPHYRFRVDS